MQNKKNKGFTQHHFLKIKKGAKNLFNTTFYVKKKSGAGFTLIEVLVGVTVFALVMGIAAGLFIHVLESQKKALAYQELLDQTSFVMEYMTRGIRMAKKQRADALPVACIATVGHNYQTNSPDYNSLKFIRWDHLKGADGAFVCYEFRLNATTLEVSRDAGVNFFPLTSPKLEVTTLRFNVIGYGDESPVEARLQPRVTIVLEVKGEKYNPERPRPKIHLQTTVSQRDLDFPLPSP